MEEEVIENGFHLLSVFLSVNQLVDVITGLESILPFFHG